MEGGTNDNFMDTVRKNWAAVPSLRKSLEVTTSPSKWDIAVEERNANGDDV